ncbi:hypothetical protein [Spirosoma koreense]
MLFACHRSDLSTSPVTDPAQLVVNIVVQRHLFTDGHVNNSIQAYLKDAKGRSIANPAIQVKANGQKLRLNNGSSNYYGAFPYYELISSGSAIAGNTTYTFTVVLTDGSEYEMGQIETQPELATDQFPLPAAHVRSQPLGLRWRGIEPGNRLSTLWKRWQHETSKSELLVSKINETKDRWGYLHEETGSTDQADYLTLNVSTGNGSYTIPRTYFEGPQRRFTALGMLLTSTKRTDLSQPFREGSSLTSERVVHYRIDMVD